MRVEVEHFKTVDGSDTLSIAPYGSNRQWYIWMKEDGSGILVIDSLKQRVSLPANFVKSENQPR